jgi:excisionase family DNA binding protein
MVCLVLFIMSVIVTMPPPDKTIFSSGEACGYAGLSWNTLKGLIKAGDIYAKRVGRRYLIPKSAIDAWLNKDQDEDRAFMQSFIRGGLN